MVPSNWTFSWTFTFRQLVLRILTHIIPIALTLMTRLTEMSITPAKPLSCRTTKFAFEFNEIFAMLRTILNWDITAIWADKFFWLKLALVLWFIHGLSAVFTATKIWIFAFKTHKVGINCHSIFIRLLIIRRFGIR